MAKASSLLMSVSKFFNTFIACSTFRVANCAFAVDTNKDSVANVKTLRNRNLNCFS